MCVCAREAVVVLQLRCVWLGAVAHTQRGVVCVRGGGWSGCVMYAHRGGAGTSGVGGRGEGGGGHVKKICGLEWRRKVA